VEIDKNASRGTINHDYRHPEAELAEICLLDVQGSSFYNLESRIARRNRQGQVHSTGVLEFSQANPPHVVVVWSPPQVPVK
jgi:hypothetical protein